MNNKIMRELGFDKEVNNVAQNLCPLCSKPIDLTSFKDDLSKKEYAISGMCQACQDKMFG